MKNFFWILTHYFKRNVLVLANLLLLGLPLVFIYAFYLIGQFVSDATLMGTLAVPIVLGFQFFGADNVTDWLHLDFNGSVGARLFVTGTDQRVFFLAVIVAGWIFNFFIGMLLVTITSLLFHVDWGNYALVLLTILLLSLLSQLVGVLIYYFTKDEKSGASMAYLFGEIMLGTAILPQFISMEGTLGNIINLFPIQLGLQIIEDSSNALPNSSILLGLCTILAILVFFIGKRKKNA